MRPPFCPMLVFLGTALFELILYHRGLKVLDGLVFVFEGCPRRTEGCSFPFFSLMALRSVPHISYIRIRFFRLLWRIGPFFLRSTPCLPPPARFLREPLGDFRLTVGFRAR